MFIGQTLGVVCFIVGALSFRFEEGCEVKPWWEDKLKWPEIQFSSWMTKNGNEVIELQVFFKNKEAILDNDKIIVHQSSYALEQVRSLASNTTNHNLSTSITEGWNDFVIRVGGTYSLWYGRQSQLQLLEVSTDLNINSVRVKGSNITFNCRSDVRVWQVSKSPVAIPFDNSREQLLSLYSDSSMKPYIKVGLEDFDIRWDGKALTAITDKEVLSPFVMHNITIACATSENTVCTVKESDSGKTLTDIKLSLMPEFITVGGKNDDVFSVLLHKDKSRQLLTNYETAQIQSEDAYNGYAAVVVLAILLVIALISLAVAFYYITCRSKGTNAFETEDNNEAMLSLLPIKYTEIDEVSMVADKTDSPRQHTDIKEMELLDAVMDEEPQRLKDLMDDCGNSWTEKASETAYIQAHLLGHTESIKILDSYTFLERETLIQRVCNEYNKRVDSIFEAAQKGTYWRGVAHLLSYYKLPSTIRNAEGLSLLHLIASAKDASEGPVWRAKNIRHFLQDKSCYPNAVDYEGQTCLHHLGINASTSKKTVVWDSQKMTVEEVWKSLARIMVEFGCDPSIRDAKGKYSHEYAKDKGHKKLSDFLKKCRKKVIKKNTEKPASTTSVKEAENVKTTSVIKGEQKTISSKMNVQKPNSTVLFSEAENRDKSRPLKATTKVQRRSKSNRKTTEKLDFTTLVRVFEKGDTTSTMKLMMNHHSLLPLDVTTNPLTIFIMRGHLEITMLLLSGGAYISGCSSTSYTPLEAAHGANSIPAIFPALLRRECINRLKFEAKKVGKTDEKLQKHIEDLVSWVDKGAVIPITFDDPTKTDEEKSKEALELLCASAKLGLSLTCQMFGLLNVNLHIFSDKLKPIREAMKSGHEELIYVLSRDLQIPVFSPLEERKFPKAFFNGIWESEVKQLKRILSKFDNSEYNAWVDAVKFTSTKLEIDKVEKDIILAHICQSGLVYLLHVFRERIEIFDVNAVVDDITGCTMLHIAAMYGQSSMLEYLMSDPAINVMMKCKKDFTAAHWAAFRGHKDCVQYIEFCMKRDHGHCDRESISDFLAGYKSQLKDYEEFFIPNKLCLEVWSSPLQADKAKLLLENWFSKHKISNRTSFKNIIDKFTLDPENHGDDVLDEMKQLLKSLSERHPQFQGNIAAYQTNVEGLRMPVDSIKIFWEVTSKVFKDFEITRKDTSSCLFSLKFKSENLNENFKPQFYEAVASTLKDFRFKSSQIWLSYPCIQKHILGVVLYLAMYDKEKKKSSLMKIILVPVLRTDYRENKRDVFKHPTIKECYQKKSLIFVANINQAKWSVVTVKLVDEILSYMKEKCFVLNGCKLIMKILYSYWWFPHLENRRHNQIWNSHTCSLLTLTPKELTSFFMEEVNNTTDEDWASEMLFDRMISIFNRATMSRKGDELTSETISQLFLDNSYSTYKALYIVRCTIKMLENLKRN